MDTKSPFYRHVFTCQVDNINGLYRIIGYDRDPFSPETFRLETKTDAIPDWRRVRVEIYDDPDDDPTV